MLCYGKSFLIHSNQHLQKTKKKRYAKKRNTIVLQVAKLNTLHHSTPPYRYSYQDLSIWLYGCMGNGRKSGPIRTITNRVRSGAETRYCTKFHEYISNITPFRLNLRKERKKRDRQTYSERGCESIKSSMYLKYFWVLQHTSAHIQYIVV